MVNSLWQLEDLSTNYFLVRPLFFIQDVFFFGVMYFVFTQSGGKLSTRGKGSCLFEMMGDGMVLNC